METESFSFRLEDLATAFDCLDTPQTHDAKDDVLLTIELTKNWNTPSTPHSKFYTQQHDTAAFNAPNCYLKSPSCRLAMTTPPSFTTMNGWWLAKHPKPPTSYWTSMPTIISPDSFSDYSTNQILQ